MHERTILRRNRHSSQRDANERKGTRLQLPKPIPRLRAEWLACPLVLQHPSTSSAKKSKWYVCYPLCCGLISNVYEYQYDCRVPRYCRVLYWCEYEYCTRLGASPEQVVRDVNPDMGFRVFDKPTSES